MAIAIMCSGGDCAGMNPAIKSFVDYCFAQKIHPFFIYDGLEGLIDGNIQPATHKDVAGIMHLGGTIIRTSRSKRFFEKEYRQQAFLNLQQHHIDKIIVLGGDGSFNALNIFSQEFNLSFIGIPSTIDNDIALTEYCLGVDTSLNVIKHALDDIRDTSSSFKRAFVVETMGRDSGYLAAVSAITSGAEICIIPEIPYDLQSIQKRLQQELDEGRSYILAIVAEGCKITQEIVSFIENELHMETRTLILGHIQRGGNPTVFDRLIADEYITFAIDRLLKYNSIQEAIVYQKSQFNFVNIEDIITHKNRLNPKVLKLVKPLCS